MKKLLPICIIFMLCVCGCTFSEETDADGRSLNEFSEDLANDILGENIPDQESVSTYKYSGDITFVPISYQHIDDGTTGLDILQYVNLDTGVMYVYTEKYKRGYATTLCELRHPDGTLMVYEDLETLREKYNWNEN